MTGWIIGLILVVLGISLFFDVYFWLKNRYQQAEQDRMEEEMVERLEAISTTFSDFRTDVDTALTNVEERTKALSDPTQREKQIAREVQECWQVSMLEQAEKFDKELKTAYDKACGAIDFQVIQYKKTIEKGRRKAYRAKKSSPPKQWRSIDDK